MMVLLRSPVNAGLCSLKMPNTRSAIQLTAIYNNYKMPRYSRQRHVKKKRATALIRSRKGDCNDLGHRPLCLNIESQNPIILKDRQWDGNYIYDPPKSVNLAAKGPMVGGA
jgi:hypothetical protein